SKSNGRLHFIVSGHGSALIRISSAARSPFHVMLFGGGYDWLLWFCVCRCRDDWPTRNFGCARSASTALLCRCPDGRDAGGVPAINRRRGQAAIDGYQGGFAATRSDGFVRGEAASFDCAQETRPVRDRQEQLREAIFRGRQLLWAWLADRE